MELEPTFWSGSCYIYFTTIQEVCRRKTFIHVLDRTLRKDFFQVFEALLQWIILMVAQEKKTAQTSRHQMKKLVLKLLFPPGSGSQGGYKYMIN